MSDIHHYTQERRAQLPLALRRCEVLLELRKSGLGGERFLQKLLSSKKLVPLPIPGATQARFSTARVMEIIEQAFVNRQEEPSHGNHG